MIQEGKDHLFSLENLVCCQLELNICEAWAGRLPKGRDWGKGLGHQGQDPVLRFRVTFGSALSVTVGSGLTSCSWTLATEDPFKGVGLIHGLSVALSDESGRS